MSRNGTAPVQTTSRRQGLRGLLTLGVLCLLPTSSAAQGTYAQVNGVRLYYEIGGSGTPLVLIHGWATNSDYWEDQVPAFRVHHRVLRYDRRGFGRSGGVPDLTADPTDLDSLLTFLGIERAAVLGHSQGGKSAMGFTVHYPERVSALILFAGGASEGLDLSSMPELLDRGELVRVARRFGLDSMWAFLATAPTFAQDELTPEIRALLERIKATYSGADLLQKLVPSGQTELPTLTSVVGIRVPTLVLIGEAEPPRMKMIADTLAALIPGARQLRLQGGGHLINLSRQAAFNAAVLGFLAEAGGVGGAMQSLTPWATESPSAPRTSSAPRSAPPPPPRRPERGPS